MAVRGSPGGSLGAEQELRAEGLEGIRIPEEQGAVGRASAKAQDWDQLWGLRNGVRE